jgi:hypothetical protein
VIIFFNFRADRAALPAFSQSFSQCENFNSFDRGGRAEGPLRHAKTLTQ